METVSDLDVERGYEVARETQEAESIMNWFLPLVQDLMWDDFSDKLYTYLSNINGEKRLAEVNKWKEYMLSYGDELKSLFWDEYVFNGSMKELEPFFKWLEVMENEKNENNFQHWMMLCEKWRQQKVYWLNLLLNLIFLIWKQKLFDRSI